MRLLALFAITAACGVPGEWPHTRDADWVVRILHRAGFEQHGCTGSAFTIELPGGGDLYVWANTTRRVEAEPNMRVRIIVGARVRLDRLRATWRARSRSVWIQAGPTTRRLPASSRWSRLVAASRAVG